MKPTILLRSSAEIVPSAAAIRAHIAMLAFAKSLFWYLPTCTLVSAVSPCSRDLSWSHSAMGFLSSIFG